MARRKTATARHRRDRGDRRDTVMSRLHRIEKQLGEVLKRMDDPVDLTKLKAALGKLEKSTGKLKKTVDENQPQG